MATKISAPAVSRFLRTSGILVTPAAAPLSMGGLRVNRSAATGEVVVQAILGVGRQRQEERLAAIAVEALREGGYTVRVSEIDASIVYVNKES